jgi:putative cell wall-binding protein
MRTLTTLLLAAVVAVPGLAGPGVSGSTHPRFEGLEHSAAAVHRIDVAAAAGRGAAAIPARAVTRGDMPMLPAAGRRARPGAPAPVLVLGPEDASTHDAPLTAGVATATEVPGGPSAPFTSIGFPGMNDTVDGFVPGCGGAPRPCLEPPDPWVAAGPSHIVQVVNVALRVTDRVGSGATTMALSNFFAEPPGQVQNADARVLYDATRGRWLASQLSYDCTAGRLYLAVSDGADPTATWTVWIFEFAGAVPDYPGIGMSADKVLLSANVFSIVPDASPPGCSIGAFGGASLVVVDWADIADGGALSGVEFGPDPTLFTWRPAAAQAPDPTAFAVVEDLEFGSSDVGLAAITGTVAGGDLAIGTFRNLTDEGLIGGFASPPAPKQPGSPATIGGAVDERPTDAVWRAGRLWTTATYPCVIETLHACVRLTELDTTDLLAANPVRQDVLLGWTGFDSYMSGVGLSVDGTAFAVYTRSSAVAPAGIQAVHQRPGDNEFRGWHEIRAGAGTYQGERWGDYVGVAADPLVPGAVWQADQYADASGGWATWVSQLAVGSIGTPGTVTRLSGPDRYATAAAISAATFDPGVAIAYVATGSNYPDALAGGAAAAYMGGPLLLVTRDAIPPATAGELTRLNPGRIVVLGGPSVVSDTVQYSLGGFSLGTVSRLSGADRYGTAAAISAATFPVGVSTAYIAVGSNFPDALAGGPAAALEDSPLLLVTSTSIPPATAAELTRLKPATIVVLGSAAGAISEAVKTALGAYATTGPGGVLRYAGVDRYATAAAISASVFPPDVSTVYLATGLNYPDALAGGPAAAVEDSPLLLVSSGSIPPATAAELVRLSPARIVVLGGPSVVSASVESALAAYVAP